MIGLARELADKGAYDSARKLNEIIRVKFPGTTFASEAEANLKDLDNRNNLAVDALARARRLVLQKKEREAAEALEQLLKSNPPRDVLNDALIERRKLDEDTPNAKLAERLAEVKRIAESDQKKARLIVLDEIVARY